MLALSASPAREPPLLVRYRQRSGLGVSVMGKVMMDLGGDNGGKSNMAGRGGVHQRRWDGVVPPECAPDPSILRLSASLAWEEAREPLHVDIDIAASRVDPGMAFARAILPEL
ncbi:hypothetical protein ZWY2020_005719 [Hordeum vulgare]|nr:hypothetical protein ZWY2020_005719 [Hordeum vulgare]